MTAGGDLKRGMKQVRDAVEKVVHEATREGNDARHINVARRTNIKVAKNVGHDGGTAHASAIQHAPIVQDGSEADNEGMDTSAPSK